MKYHIGELSCLSICHQIKVPITVSRPSLCVCAFASVHDEPSHNSCIRMNLAFYSLHIVDHDACAALLSLHQISDSLPSYWTSLSLFSRVLFISLFNFTAINLSHVFLLLPFFSSGANFIANVQAYTTQTFILIFPQRREHWLASMEPPPPLPSSVDKGIKWQSWKLTKNLLNWQMMLNYRTNTMTEIYMANDDWIQYWMPKTTTTTTTNKQQQP